MTKYARDEFDKVPEASTRQGVHRAVSLPRRRGLGAILAVGFAALAVGLVAFLILPKLGIASVGATSALTAETGTASVSPEPTASTPKSTASTPASTASTPASSSTAAGMPGGSPSPSASLQATPAAVPAVDKTQPVTIFNGTTTAGLASRVGGTVASAGWQLGSLGNWAGARQQSSVIYYNSPAQKDNAESLGLLLDIPTTVQSAEFQAPLVVVLGPGFQ